MSALPAVASNKDHSLDDALTRMVPARHLAEPADRPDAHVTTVRRMDAVAAQYAPFPEAIDSRLTEVLEARGIRQYIRIRRRPSSTPWSAGTS